MNRSRPVCGVDGVLAHHRRFLHASGCLQPSRTSSGDPRPGRHALGGNLCPKSQASAQSPGDDTVALVKIEENVLTVRGLDAIDGSPVLDIKPYVSAFDRVDQPVIPEWMERLMDGYF